MDDRDAAFLAEARLFLVPDETASALLSRTYVEPFFTSVPFMDRVSLTPGSVVEISGASGSAKSEVLLQMALTCILPQQHMGVLYEGLEGHVLLFDLDCRFDMLRLLQGLRRRISKARCKTLVMLAFLYHPPGDL
eukprot:jgi/Mesen1/7140/ME000037S06500